MFLASGLPHSLWAEAVNTAVYLLKRVTIINKARGKTFYELWASKKPNVQHIKTFGSEASAHILGQFVKKFDLKANKVVLVGYHTKTQQKNYSVYNPITRKVTVSRNVVFLGNLYQETPFFW